MADKQVNHYLDELYGLCCNTEATAGGRQVSLAAGTAAAVAALEAVRAAGRKVLLVGNGGSAAIVAHAMNDIMKASGIRAMVFDSQPLLTALANDCGYENAYREPVERWAEAGDLLIAVSSSGRSNNILLAAKAALTKDCTLVTFSGFTADNPLRDLGQINFYVPSKAYGFVESAHAILIHFITDTIMNKRAEVL